MFELKPLSREAIPAALEKAYRYRLLNEPMEAESICRDVLDVDPQNQDALITLLSEKTLPIPELADEVSARQGFTFYAHDAEHTLLNLNENRLGPSAGVGWNAGTNGVNKSNPQYFFQRLWDLPSFKTRVADRVLGTTPGGRYLDLVSVEGGFELRVAFIAGMALRLAPRFAGQPLRFSAITAPALALLLFRDTIFSLQSSFVPALIVTEGGPPPYATTYLPLFVYQNAFEYLRYGYAAAATVVLVLMTAAIVLIQLWLLRRWQRAARRRWRSGTPRPGRCRCPRRRPGR